MLHYGFRFKVPLHSKQLQDVVTSNSPVMMKRSLFGVVRIYNRLSQDVVDNKNVKIFQKQLQDIAKPRLRITPHGNLSTIESFSFKTVMMCIL